MDWERAQRRLLKAERLVVEAEGYVARARQAISRGRGIGGCSIPAEEALKSMEAMLERDIEKRDRLREQLRLLTH